MAARAPETAGDGGVVVRPDGTEVIGVRVVARMVAGQRADPPPAPHVRLHQAIHHARSPVRRDDAAGQAVAGIGRHGADGLLVAVEAEVVGALALPPKGFVEALVQCQRLALELSRPFLLAP